MVLLLVGGNKATLTYKKEISMLTKNDHVTSVISIWAVPLSDWQIAELEEGALPFEYETHTTTKPWKRGAVKVTEHNVTLSVPEGVNLLEKAIETLEEAIEDRKKQYHTDVAEINQRIQELLLLTYVPAEEPTEEVILAEEAEGPSSDMV